jgi:hypothetical protein
VKLLIVDDYPANRKLLRVALEAQGHLVREAANGIEALEELGRESLDGVVSDILMPGMDGFRLCLEVRKREALRSMPVVLYTSTYESPTDRRLAQLVGADAYILKPAPTTVILQEIETANRRPDRHCRPATAAALDPEVLEQYNATLVRKLETRNTELQQALTGLAAAHDQILELTRTLETRVAQRTAALEAANRELEAFSHSISNDLLSRVRNIAALARSLNSDSNAILDTNTSARIAEIVTDAQQMDRHLQTVLDFSRVGRIPLQLEDIDLEVVLDEALASLHAATASRNIEWHRSRLPCAHADAALIRQVFVQLLSNAIKFTRTRKAALIEIGSRPGRADEVVIFIKDNGVGFDLRRAVDLFGVFKRMHDPSVFEGIGMGLASAQRIIRRHGGTIWAEASTDRGATFFLTLGQP